jgi:steroid 5-alpha reductase family enzyme
MVFTFICVWGFRLTYNFVSRGGIGHEDWRYTNMRQQFGAHFWWISLFSVFIGQTIFLFMPCLSLYGAIQGTGSPGILDVAAALVCFSAIALETVADAQMNNFIQAKRENCTQSVMIDTGLWQLSRHPNYLGEILFWWGLWLFSASAGGAAWVVAGPLTITALFVFVSVKLMEDRQLKNKGEAFEEYRRKVGSPLLLMPPGLNRRLGEWLHGPSPSK